MRISRTTLLAAAVLGGLGLGASAHADLIKRGMLIKACTGRGSTDASDCAGYIAGVADLATNPPPGGPKAEVCLAPGIKVKVLREAVTSYLQSHPGADGPAAPAVYEALKTLYKCGS